MHQLFGGDRVTSGPPPRREPPAPAAAEPPASELEDLARDEAEGDRPSITDVHGTVARFEMSYSPIEGERITFGPPLRMRLPAFVYLAFCVALVATVFIAHHSSSNSSLYRWIVEGDRGRPLSAAALSFIVFVSGIGTVIRAHMRGVVVHSDGIEGRYLLALGIPRVRRWAWAQVHRMLVDDTQVMIELWDGSYERLPEVKNTHKLVELLENIAGSRRIEMTHLSPVDLTKKKR
jgi:hypothetical protein